MATLFDEACLQRFPIDAALDAFMMERGAVPLTPEQVKVTLRDDPGRGWIVRDGDADMLVILETPPYHACSVRRSVGGGAIDLGAYRPIADAFTAAHRGFAPQKPMDANMGDLHIHADNTYRQLPGGGGEQLMVIAQTVTDPVRRAKGETGTMLRFVHQIATEK